MGTAATPEGMAQIDQETLDRLTDSELRDLLAAHEALYRANCRDNITAFTKSVELPGAPPALTAAQRAHLATSKNSLRYTVKDDARGFFEDESFDGDDEFLYGHKVDVAEHQELILEVIKATIEDQPIVGSLANGMEGIAPDGVMIFAPPGSAKSTYASVAAPAYLLGRYRDFDIISVSYAAELARRFGRRVRHTCRSNDFADIFETSIREDNQAVDQWSLMNGSSYRAVGIMGGVTGFRADLLLIDDPVAGREEADSEIIREKTWQAYHDDLSTRLKPGGKIVIIQTRWHEDDLSGRILGPDWEGQSGLRKGTDGRIWLVICLPLVAEHKDDPLGRKPGEVLWHKKPDGSGWFTDRHVELAKASGDRSWSALYQQRPSAAEGNIIRRDLWRCWPHGNPNPTDEQLKNPRATQPPSEISAIMLSYDTAFEADEDNDDSAMTAWGYFEKTVTLPQRRNEQIKQQNIILLGAWKHQVDAIELQAIVKDHVAYFKPDVVIIEKRASGIQLIQELKLSRPRWKDNAGRVVEVVVESFLPAGKPGAKGKRARALRAALVMSEGCVWYMPGPRTEAVRKQCAAFKTGTDGTPDDWTDTVTSAIERSRKGFDLQRISDEYDDDEQAEMDAIRLERQTHPRRSYGNLPTKPRAVADDDDDDQEDRRSKNVRAVRKLYGRR